MARGGVYWRLRDPATPWADRNKLIRYAWRHHAVHIPNKHQVLLDWLTLALTGKKRVSGKEAEGPWRCLCDILQSRACQMGVGTRQTLVLKAVVGQVLLKELKDHAADRPGSCVSVGTVLSCVEAIISSCSLHLVFTNRIDVMIQLLAVTSDLCVQDMEAGVSPTVEKVALLKLLLRKLSQTAWRRINVQQAVSSASQSLLLSAARFTSVVKRCVVTNLYTEADQLTSFTRQALFQYDLWEHYQLYIGVKVSSKSPAPGVALPKDAEVMFKVMEKLLTSEETRDYVLHYLPVLYAGFLDAYKPTKTLEGLKLLILLTQLMGLDLQPEGHVKVKGQDIVTLTLLLEVAVEYDVYDVSYDGSLEERQLPWLQSLGAWLLSLTDRCVSWYDCLLHLMKMDYKSLEPRLPELLSAAWINDTVKDVEQTQAQGRLLGYIFTLYGRLRRVPALIDRCLSAFRSHSQTTPLLWPEELNDSLTSLVSALPPNTCVTLWQTIVTEMTSHYLTNANSGGSRSLPALSHLLTTLLHHARLADYTVPLQVAAQVRDLLVVTSRDVCDVMLHAVLREDGADLVTALSLTVACGELRLLLAQFTDLPLGVSTVTGATCWTDLTLVHAGVSSEDWVSVCQEASRRDDKRALHLIDELVLQKLRAVLLLVSPTGDDSKQETIKNLATHLLQRLPQEGSTTSWNQQVDGVDESNHQVALFDLLCRHVTLLVPFWTEDQILKFVQFVIDVMLHDVTSRPSHHVTLQSIASGLLRSATWIELRALESALVTVVFSRLSQLCASNKGVKRTPATQSAQRVLHALTDTTCRSPISDGDGELAKSVLETGSQDVMALFTSQEQMATVGDERQGLALLNILEKLPLEYFLPVNKARCVLGLLVMTRTNQSQLVAAGLRQLAVVLHGSEMVSVVRVLDPGSLLLWLVQTADTDCNTLSVRGDVTFNLVKHATKDLASTQALKPFFTQCHQVVARACEGHSTSGPQMALVTKTLSTLRNVVERTHQEAALRSVCLTYFSELAMVLLRLLSSALRAQEGPVDRVSGLDSALQAYRHSLDHMCHVMRRQHHDKANQKKDKVAESGSESAPDSESDREDSGPEAETGSRQLWTELLSHLPSVCSGILRMLRTDQDDEVILSCLPLVATICTNWVHLKHHLAADFRQEVLELVLGKLHTSDENEATDTSRIAPGLTQLVEAMEVTTEGDEVQGRAVRQAARQTAVAIMTSLDNDQFSRNLHHLLQPVVASGLAQTQWQVVTALDTLHELLDTRLSDDNKQTLKYACQNVLNPLHEVLAVCMLGPLHQSSLAVLQSALSLQTKMLSYGPSLLSARCVSVCLHSCQYVPLETVTDIHTFAAVHRATYELLNAMLVHHSKIVFGFIPTFTKSCKTLMTSLIAQSAQTPAGRTPEDAELLVTCALRIYRLFSLMATHKVDFQKVAPYIMADYIHHIQKVTVLPKVKKSIISGLHKILDLCDEHAVRMLSTVLPPSGKEVFKRLHDEFTQYHRYRGRI